MSKERVGPSKVSQPPFCQATVDENGELSIQYRHEAGGKIGNQSHDEEVGDWPDRDIEKLVRELIDLDPSIEVDLENMYISGEE